METIELLYWICITPAIALLAFAVGLPLVCQINWWRDDTDPLPFCVECGAVIGLTEGPVMLDNAPLHSYCAALVLGEDTEEGRAIKTEERRCSNQH